VRLRTAAAPAAAAPPPSHAAAAAALQARFAGRPAPRLNITPRTLLRLYAWRFLHHSFWALCEVTVRCAWAPLPAAGGWQRRAPRPPARPLGGSSREVGPLRPGGPAPGGGSRARRAVPRGDPPALRPSRACRVCSPIALRQFLRWMAGEGAQPGAGQAAGWGWALLLCTGGALMIVIHHQFFWWGAGLGAAAASAAAAQPAQACCRSQRPLSLAARASC
jgi:hypothetical protein